MLEKWPAGDTYNSTGGGKTWRDGGRVRQIIVDGQLTATKIGRDNLIKASDLVLVRDRKVGRLPKKDNPGERAGQKSRKNSNR